MIPLPSRSSRLSHQRGLFWNAFLLGSAIGFISHVMAFAAFYSIIKIWGQNPTLNWFLSFWQILTVPLPAVVTLAFFCSKAKKLNMRKVKLDPDVDTPADGSNSISWTEHHMLFIMHICFVHGCNVGSCSLWGIVDLRMVGLAARRAFLLKTVGVDFVLFWITIKLFDWITIKHFDWVEHAHANGEEHEEEEENVEHEASVGSVNA